MRIPLNDLVWLASYPRSGNTLLRLILFHRFGLRTRSIYVDEFGQTPRIREIIGVDDHSPLIKTHQRCEDNLKIGRAIYLSRDREKAEHSLAQYSGGDEKAIHDLNEHSKHLLSWSDRPSTLYLRYEQLKTNETLDRLCRFLEVDVIPGSQIPTRQELQSIDPHFFRVCDETQ